MGWHLKGDPHKPSALTFLEPVGCFYCHEDLSPDDAYCFWGGGSTATEDVEPDNFDADDPDTYPMLIRASGHIIFHPDCALILSHQLIKDAMLADNYGARPYVGQVGRQRDGFS